MTAIERVGTASATGVTQIRSQPWAAAMIVGGLLCLTGQRLAGFVLLGGVLAWALREGAAHDARRRARGRAVALVALAATISISLPEFLGPAGDGLLTICLVAAPVGWLWLRSPEVRRVLVLHRLSALERVLLAWSALAAVVIGLFVAPLGPWLGARSAVAVVGLSALLLPFFDEAVYRGLLMDAVGTTVPAVVLVAVVQGVVVGAGYGWLPMLLTVALALGLGHVRRVTGRWQAALMTHLGISLGLVIPYFLAAGAAR